MWLESFHAKLGPNYLQQNIQLTEANFSSVPAKILSGASRFIPLIISEEKSGGCGTVGADNKLRFARALQELIRAREPSAPKPPSSSQHVRKPPGIMQKLTHASLEVADAPFEGAISQPRAADSDSNSLERSLFHLTPSDVK